MYDTAYDLVALGMRYFFIALIVYILFRVVQHSLKEYKAVQLIKQQVRSVSPGYLEILAPEDLVGERLPLRRENTIGKSKRCDIWVDAPGLEPAHAFIYEKKDGLYIAPYGSKNTVKINGVPVGRHEELLYEQDELKMGELIAVLHLSGAEDETPEEQNDA